MDTRALLKNLPPRRVPLFARFRVACIFIYFLTGHQLFRRRAHCVALVTGEGFGYPKGIRISYAASMGELEEALGEVRRKTWALLGS